MEVSTIGSFLGNGFETQSLVGSMAELFLLPKTQGSSLYYDFWNSDIWAK